MFVFFLISNFAFLYRLCTRIWRKNVPSPIWSLQRCVMVLTKIVLTDVDEHDDESEKQLLLKDSHC